MTEGWITVNGMNLWAAEQGRGYPVFLSPGGPGCEDYLAPVAGLIDDIARVIRWEPRGCGESDRAGPYDLATTLADMDAIRESMGFERWIVGGHSHGAFLALAYAVEFPNRVDAIVYLSGIGIQNDRAWHIAYADARDTIGEPTPEWRIEPNLDVNREGNESAREWCRDPYLLQRLRDLDIPLLAVQGGEDIRPSWPVEQLVHLMPQAGIVTLPEAGHYLWFTHADSLRAVLRGFLTPLVENQTS